MASFTTFPAYIHPFSGQVPDSNIITVTELLLTDTTVNFGRNPSNPVTIFTHIRYHDMSKVGPGFGYIKKQPTTFYVLFVFHTSLTAFPSDERFWEAEGPPDPDTVKGMLRKRNAAIVPEVLASLERLYKQLEAELAKTTS